MSIIEAASNIIRPLVLGQKLERATALTQRQELLVRNPLHDLREDFISIYENGVINVGMPAEIARIFDYFAQKNVYLVLGAQLGDEGKGRIVDNILDYLNTKIGLKKVYVTRFQGGSNAGHTLESGNKRVKLHQIPSMVFTPERVESVGIMDAGMNLNPVELFREYQYVEAVVGMDALKDKLVVSSNAILNTDLDRAEESLLDLLEGKTSGSTGEGMRTSSAHYYDRTGLRYEDLLKDDWEEVLGKKYDQLAERFTLLDRNLQVINVPDYDTVVANELAETRGERQSEEGEKIRPVRPIGTKKEFLDRLTEVRSWLRQKNLIQDTISINYQSLAEVLSGKAGHIFEGAQAIGLHPWLGTIGARDTTSTDTSANGVLYATKVFRVNDIPYIIGAIKATYMSSVGKRRMKTQVALEKKVRRLSDLDRSASSEQRWAAWVRETAREFGTTTGRPRDICFLDLPFLAYNCLVGNINMLAATHLDIARPGKKIKVCNYYIRDTQPIAYYPGIETDPDAKPHYIELDGWDGAEVRKAKSFAELPKAAQKYLSYIQARVGVPIVFSTTGPDRNNQITIPEQRGKKGFVEKVYDRLSPRGRIFPN